ncbi:MAG TPA: hypothetical protein VME70_01775 [Mycobacteriales bacterium]|nr:hypothetical protein [Mycobacteriales bacterium]
MSALQFIASLANSLAWPIAVVVAAIVLREQLRDAFGRIQSLKLPWGEATFATLAPYEQALAVAAKNADSPEDAAVVRREATAFGVLEELAATAPAQAVIDAWGLLEYQLNMASDRIAPNQPHGWPQVALNLERLDNWPLLSPAIGELRRLRDYTVESSWPPSTADAVRYVSLAQDLATTLRTSVISECGDEVSGAR